MPILGRYKVDYMYYVYNSNEGIQFNNNQQFYNCQAYFTS